MDYQDFAIKIAAPRNRGYPVQVLRSPAGEGKGRLWLPADVSSLLYPWVEPEPDWESFSREEDWGPARRIDPAIRIGSRLFESLFTGEVGRLYERSRGIVEARPGMGLRLRFHFDMEELALARLAVLPWELLHDPGIGGFLSLHRLLPVVRSLDVPQPGRPLGFEPPLRILLAASHPERMPKLDLECERRKILAAWERGQPAALDVLEHATPASLRDRLLAGRHQVLHFLGHGWFDLRNMGLLFFEHDDGGLFAVAGHVLGYLLSGLPELRLVVLNACDSARSREDGRDPYSAVATALVRAGVPAVVGMRAPIRDRAAIAFAARLYERLSLRDPLEAAVTEARLAISTERPETVDWAVPVLFLRSPSGSLEAYAPEPARGGATASATDLELFMAERPAEDFVERPHLVEPVIASLLTPDAPAPVGLAAAFRGAGGYGKTTLARAVCHDPRVRRAFSDGILWVTLGEQPHNLTGSLRDLIYQISGERPGFASLEAATACWSALLERRRMLIVIDDVWSPSHLRPFLQGGRRCARLVTTRDRTVLPAGSSVVQVDAMQQDEALRLLASGLPVGQRKALEHLAGRLGHWPLLLRLVNGVLRDRLLDAGEELAGALLYVGASLDRHGLTAFDVADPSDRHRAVASTLGVSLDRLSPESRSRFLDLAIFPEDAEIPFSAVGRLWDDLPPLDVETLCMRLHQLSLLLKAEPKRRLIRLHDVIRSFLVRQQQALLPDLHSRFLAAGRRAVSGRWRDLPREEAYLWSHLSYHLAEARLAEELVATVEDLMFLVTRVVLGDPHGAERDLVRAGYLAPEDGRLRALHTAFSNAKHLLVPDHGTEEIAATLLSRLIAAPVLATLVAAAEEELSEPRLRPRFPLPDSPDPALLRTLAVYEGSVQACSVTANGDRVVTAGEDGSVILWDAILGTEVWTVLEAVEIPDDEDPGNCDSACALSADGSTLLSADVQGTVRVWDVATRVELSRIEAREGKVISCVLSAEGRRAACRWALGRLCLFATSDGEILLQTRIALSPRGGCALSADGGLLLATSGRELWLWDLARGGELRSWVAHEARANGCALTADGTRALSVSDDRTAKLWDTEARQEIHRFTLGDEGYACALTARGEIAVLGGDSAEVSVWNARTGERLRVLTGHLSSVETCAIDAGGGLIVTGSGDLTVKLWRDPLVAPALFPPFQAELRDCAVDATGRLLAGAAMDTTLRIWDARTGEPLHVFRGHTTALTGCAFTPDGKSVVSIADNGGLRIWDLGKGHERSVMVEKGTVLTACALSGKGDRFAAADRDGGVQIWDACRWQRLRRLDGGSSVPTRCRFSADGGLLLLASRDRRIRIWELATDSEPLLLAGHSDEVNGCAISPDGSTIASASDDHTLRLWDLKGRQIRLLEGHSGPVRDCAFHPDGSLLVAVSADIGVSSTVKVWSLGEGLCLASLRVDGELSVCGWMPDGAAIFAAGRYGVYVFDW